MFILIESAIWLVIKELQNTQTHAEFQQEKHGNHLVNLVFSDIKDHHPAKYGPDPCGATQCMEAVSI